MDHRPQRRHVVAVPHLLGQLEQAVEHGRDHVGVGDLVALDALEGALRGPPVHQHDGVAHVQRHRRPVVDRGVVGGCLGDLHVVVVGHGPEEHEQAPRPCGGLVGMGVAQPPAHPLGPAGGARGVEHERPGRQVVGPGLRLTVDELGEGPEARHPAHREAVGLGRHAVLEDPHRLVGEARRDDQRLRLRVVDDVGDLGAHEVPVDRRDVEAALVGRQADRDLLEAVGQHGGHLVAPLQPQGPQPVDDPVGERGELTEGHLPVLGIDEGEVVGVGLRDPPEPGHIGVGHGRDGAPDAPAVSNPPIGAGGADGAPASADRVSRPVRPG